MIERSKFGLENYDLFHGVDIVVFVEGGTSTPSSTPTPSNDEEFWYALFSVFLREYRVRIKSRGPKSHLLELADKLSETSRTFVAVDADLDWTIYSDQSRSSRILFTYGYSWEADLIEKSIIEDVLKKALPLRGHMDFASRFARYSFDNFRTQAGKVAHLDLACHCAGLHILHRDMIRRLLDRKSSLPINDKEVIVFFRHVYKALRGNNFRLNYRLIDPQSMVFGHACALYLGHVVRHAQKELKLRAACPHDFIMRLAIDAFEQNIEVDPDLRRKRLHYGLQMRKISWRV